MIASFSGLPWGDLPNHITRITILGDLLFSPDSVYHKYYSFEWTFAPYLLWDLVGILTSRVLPVIANGVLWAVVTFLAVVGGGWYLARARLSTPEDRAVLYVVSVVMACGWCFVWGFFAYQISMGLTLLAAGLVYRLGQQTGPGARAAYYGAYVLTAVCCYLAHLGGFLALCLVAGGIAVARGLLQERRHLLEAALILMPPGLLAIWHVLLGESAQAGGEVVTRTVGNKMLALAGPWLRLPVLGELPLLIGMAGAVLLLGAAAVRAFRVLPWKTVVKNDAFCVFVLLGGMYVVLPQGVGTAWDVDVRMVPFALYFLVLWLVVCVRAGAPGVGVRPAAAVVMAGCAVSLVVLYVTVRPYDREARLYQEALRRIPPYQVVLPVPTRPYIGRMGPLHHQGNLYGAFGRGMAPYLFNREYGTLPFFAFREQYHVPGNLWYIRDVPTPNVVPDPRIDYVIVSKPYDESRLAGVGTDVVFENEAAVVFRTAGGPGR